ncbi:MAG: hypothetical protein HN348_29750, partial [Proteobacteria bacterium]|nr:hypothetical protein [Pseudomonadota bacterium]
MQRLISTLHGAIEGLGVDIGEPDLEFCAVLIHASMSGRGRSFHSIKHVFDVQGHGADPLTTLAALFHDTVYYQVDGGLSGKRAMLLDGVVRDGESGVVLANEGDDELTAMVAAVFGFDGGQVLSPFGGLNEFLSAVLAGRVLSSILSLRQLCQVAACIEATIPFRGKSSYDALYERLQGVSSTYALALSDEELVAAIHRAVELANRDVANFAFPEVAWFLDNTWKLLPESNVPLRHQTTYTIFEYNSAIHKMHEFFGFLDPKVVFASFRGVPEPACVEHLTSRARHNLDVGHRYLGAKKVTMSLLMALARLTGGDAPLALFMGDLPEVGFTPQRLEMFLPQPKAFAASCDPEVFALLAVGRRSESTFDLRNSPLSAHLYASLGDDGVAAILGEAPLPDDVEMSSKFLEFVPAWLCREVALACARMVDTRA